MRKRPLCGVSPRRILDGRTTPFCRQVELTKHLLKREREWGMNEQRPNYLKTCAPVWMLPRRTKISIGDLIRIHGTSLCYSLPCLIPLRHTPDRRRIFFARGTTRRHNSSIREDCSRQTSTRNSKQVPQIHYQECFEGGGGKVSKPSTPAGKGASPI